MKTVLRCYNFDTSKPEEAAQWEALKAELSNRGGPRCFETHGGESHYFSVKHLDGREVELDPANLLSFDQWNLKPIPGDSSEKGRRVFDWAKDYESHIGAPRGIKRGHYLDLTEEMRAIRDNTAKCRYCGTRAPVPGPGDSPFCGSCLGFEYLKPEDLKLLRLIPVSREDDEKARPDLTEDEKAGLMARYVAAQTGATDERARKRLEAAHLKVESDYEKAIAKATAERDGFRFLLSHGFPLDNVIFYSHTGRFAFGWRNPVSEEVKSRLLEIVSDFPFPYDIKTQEGRTLSGE
jgi:hypothetical protein